MKNLSYHPFLQVSDHWRFDVSFYRKNLEYHGFPDGVDYLMFKNTTVNGVFYHHGAISTSDNYTIEVSTDGSCVVVSTTSLVQEETVVYSRNELGRGALSYIDGGTNTTAINPRRRGEPVVNYVHFPAGMCQTLHTHPSQRVGFVLKGNGVVELNNHKHYNVNEGEAFLMDRLELHNFITPDEDVVLLVWAPDSDAGATDSDNALLNRTYVGLKRD